MRTVLLGDRPPVVDEWLRLRRERGQDLFDEVWEGEYHVAPAPSRRHGQVDDQLARILGPRTDDVGLVASGPCNIGQSDDYRVPDKAYFRDRTPLTSSPTAAIVVEVVSPDDESRAKLGFYHGAGVDEVFLADPELRTVEILLRGPTRYERADASQILGVAATELAASIDWPD